MFIFLGPIDSCKFFAFLSSLAVRWCQPHIKKPLPLLSRLTHKPNKSLAMNPLEQTERFWCSFRVSIYMTCAINTHRHVSFAMIQGLDYVQLGRLQTSPLGSLHYERRTYHRNASSPGVLLDMSSRAKKCPAPAGFRIQEKGCVFESPFWLDGSTKYCTSWDDRSRMITFYCQFI